MRELNDIAASLRAFVRSHPLISAIVVLGGILRLAGILWGIPLLPHRYNFHPDEWPYLLALYSFPHHIIFQKKITYPMFVPYMISLFSPFNVFFSTISNIVNLIITGKGGAVSFTWIFFKLMGRFATVLMGTASIALTAAVGRRLFGWTAAIAAAAFVAFTPFAVQNATFFTPAIPSSFFMVLLLLISLQLRERTDVRIYAALALTNGALAATLYPGAVGALIPLTLHLEAAGRECGFKSRLRFLIGWRLWLFILVSVAVFFALSPGNVIYFGNMLATIADELWRASTAVPVDRASLYAWLQLFLKNIELMGPPFVLLVAAAIIYNLIRINRNSFMLLVVPIVCWIAFVGTMRPRHMVLLIPLYALLVGRMIGDALAVRSRIVRVACAVIFAALVGMSFAYNVDELWERYNDKRPLAAQFIEHQISHGSTVGIKCLEGGDVAYKHEHFNEFMWDFPLINPKHYQLTDCLKNPQYLILSEYSDKYPETAFSSGLLRGDIWPQDETGMWWREKIPEPRLMHLYRDLITRTSSCYELIKDYPSRNTERDFFRVYYEIQRFQRPDWKAIKRLYFTPFQFFSFEYPSPQIRIYKRTDACNKAEAP